jgi:hypothetical protein
MTTYQNFKGVFALSVRTLAHLGRDSLWIMLMKLGRFGVYSVGSVIEVLVYFMIVWN